jgi:hypothetical protein
MWHAGVMTSTYALTAIAGATVFLAACGSGLPRPRLYQVEEAVDIAQGEAGERYAAHRTCVKSTTGLDPLLTCMQNSGYTFIARGPDYPAAECWQLRERGGNDLPPPYCFERTAKVESR